MKIGIVTISDHVSYSQYQFVKSLIEHDGFELSLIQGEIKNNAVQGIASRILKLQYQLETKILKGITRNKQIAPNWSVHKLFQNALISTEALGSRHGTELVFNNQTEVILKEAELDLLISLHGPIDIPDLENISRFGILSTSCDSLLKPGLTPSGFWEVYQRDSASGFHIALKPSSLDELSYILKGYCTTKDLCWQNNLNYLQKECYHQLLNIILKAKINNGFEIREMVSEVDIQNHIPKWYQLIRYNAILLGSTLKKVKRFLTKAEDYWTVYYATGTPDNINFGKATKVSNPIGGYFADPFIIRYDNRDILLVEEYVNKERKAVLSALEIHSEKEYSYLGEIIREDFHLSYPFVFEHNDTLYMVPESSGSKSIRLYKCTEFPMKWEYQYDIMSNIDAADTTIHFHDDKYWLLTNRQERCGEYNSILECYHSDSPISKEWHAHPQNPVIFDNGARNGGFLYHEDKSPIISQTYGLNCYGKSIQIKQIKTLSETEFALETTKEIRPDFIRGIKGTHHLSSSERYTAFDTLMHKKLK